MINKGVSYIVKQFYEPYLVRIKNKDTLFNHINYEVPEGHNYVVQLLNSMKVPLTVHVLLFIDKRQSLNMEEVMKVIKKLIIYKSFKKKVGKWAEPTFAINF